MCVGSMRDRTAKKVVGEGRGGDRTTQVCSELQARFGGGGQYFDPPPPPQTSFHPVALIGSPFGRTVISSGRGSTVVSLILMDSGSIRPFSFSAPLKGGEDEASH